MAFKDVIDDYSDGATGTITTVNGGSIGYTVSGTAPTRTFDHHGDQSAQIFGDGSNHVDVTFDQAVEGVSITMFRSNEDESYALVVDGQVVDLNALIAAGDASFSNIGTAATHKVNPDGTLSGGHHTDGSVGYVVFHVPVLSVGVTGAGGGGFDGFEIGIDYTSFSAVCFAGEAQLRTRTGTIAAQDVAPGDVLWTMQNGFQPVLWTFKRSLSGGQLAANPLLQPVRIAAGALGHGLPRRALRVSRQHRLLVSSKIAERVVGEAQILLPAFRLLALDGVEVDPSPDGVTYVHVLLQHHQILDAEGAPSESLLTGPVALRALSPGALAELAALLPDALAPLSATMPARHVPAPSAQKDIARRHAENRQPVLQTYPPP